MPKKEPSGGGFDPGAPEGSDLIDFWAFPDKKISGHFLLATPCG